MPLPIVSSFENRQAFLDFLKTNPGLIIIKFGATWCGPCKRVEPIIQSRLQDFPDTVQPVIIDIDDSIDVYAFLKTKKIVPHIPTVLCYVKGNTHFTPDEMVSSSDEVQVNAFFDACHDHL